MAIEDIKKELEEKFNRPLDEFYKRRIIFWNDEEGQFKDEVNELELDNAEVLILSENNQFASKRLLSSGDLEHNYLVYNPLNTDKENDWFLDIKLYSEEYRADMVSRWMDEMKIDNTVELRNEVKQFKEFFKASKRRSLLNPSDEKIKTKNYLYMSILAAISGVKERTPSSIIQAVLADGDDINNQIKVDLLKYSASDLFWSMVNRTTGYSGTNVDELRIHVVLSAISRTMSSKVLSGLEGKYSDVHSGFCYELLFNWIHSNDVDTFKEISEEVSNTLDLLNRFNRFSVEELENTDVVPVIDEVIISKLIDSICNRTVDIEALFKTIEKRRTSAWIDDYSCFYDCIHQAGLMRKFHDEHMDSFHHTVASEMWKAYTEDYYQMDTMYRDFHTAFSVCLIKNPNLEDEIKNLADYIEGEYKVWFLDKLGANWTKVIEDDLKETGNIKDIPQQVNFYSQMVRPTEGRVLVIISDAMRYEVAHSLARELEIATKADVEITAQQGIYPTITEFGMPALLPHKKLEAVNKDGKVEVLIDDHSTEMSDRDGILKSYSENSIALKYKDIMSMKREERRNTFKGKDIIYIYHDVIDNSGHNESNVFDACTTTIQELTSLVNTFCMDNNGINVLITSDHGFLYTYKELSEEDKVSRQSFKKNIITQGRRYVITDEQADPDFLMPVKGIYNKGNMLGFAPRENIRLVGSGGMNFVHGGISLQEMCVPVIRFKSVRTTSKKYRENQDKYDTKPVSISLLSSNRKISNMIFNLSFYQKEAVKDSYVACNYVVSIVDSNGNEVSDVQKIIADKTSTIAKDREFKCTFNLKSQAFSNIETYYLVIKDEAGIQVPVKEPMQIDIAMAIDEFDFF
jgi:uncharacterized protein (TIGR02687 family)